jgi:hypothetical protein
MTVCGCSLPLSLHSSLGVGVARLSQYIGQNKVRLHSCRSYDGPPCVELVNRCIVHDSMLDTTLCFCGGFGEKKEVDPPERTLTD